MNDVLKSKDQLVEELSGLRRQVSMLRRREVTLSQLKDRLEETLHDLSVHQEEMRTQNEDLRIAQSELEESHKKYMDLFDFAPIGYFTFDRYGVIKEVNLTGAEMLGHQRKSIMGKPMHLYMSKTSSCEIFSSYLRGIFCDNSLSPVEVELLHKDGKTFPAEFESVSIKDDAGKTLFLRTMIKDITERKRAAESLRRSKEFIETVLNSMYDAVCIIDVHDFRIRGVNKVFLDHTGMKEEDVIGKTCYEIIHHLTETCSCPECTCPVSHVLKTGVPSVYEHIHYRDNGAKICVEVAASPIWNENGEINQIVHVGRDITDRKLLQEQLLQSQKMEAVGQLAGGVAHDFNNILTAIIGYGSLLLMNMDENAPLRSYVNHILAASNKAANLVRSLLAFSRKQIINPQPGSLNEIVKRVEKFLQRVIGEDIELKAQLTDDDLIAMVDSTQIEQVLLNLATNARDAMPEGGYLAIETSCVHIDENYVKKNLFEKAGIYGLISVTDTGIGMDEKTREQIFEPFFTTKEVGKGTGLGLSMAYGIIKHHGGNINVYSEPGGGASFLIYLPLITSKIDETESRELPPLKVGAETVLLAEDNVTVRQLLKDVLEGAGYKVIEAGNGEDAIKLFHNYKGKIQIALLDIVMPKMNGKQVYEEIKKSNPELKVLFMSGYTADIIYRKGILEPGLPFIYKPVSPNALLRKVREVLDK